MEWRLAVQGGVSSRQGSRAREARSCSMVVVTLWSGPGGRSGKCLVLGGNAGLGWDSFRSAMGFNAMLGVGMVAQVADISSDLREFLVGDVPRCWS